MSIRRYNRDDLPQLALRNREHRAGLAINVTAFFAAIGVLGWFGVSGIDLESDTAPTSQQEMDMLFARMEAEAQARADASAGNTEPHLAAAYDQPAEGEGWAEEWGGDESAFEVEDERAFGEPDSFGDPMTELFADIDEPRSDDLDDWGDPS